MEALNIRDQILNETYAFIDKRVSELLSGTLSGAAIAACSRSLQAGLAPSLEARINSNIAQVRKNNDEAAKSLNDLRVFLETPLPIGWRNYSLADRKAFWAGDRTSGVSPRDRVCALEVWVEFYNRDKWDYTRHDAREINKQIAACGAIWTRRTSVSYGNEYGLQSGFVRKVI
ncbi:MAG: hypothetical protein ACLTXZ_05990 [Oscillospiraceae bacterium]